MATSTKKALAAALKKMMEVKPIDKITVKDLVEICGVNRQTFYYHFDDVYDLLEWVVRGGRKREPPERGRVRSLEDRCYNVDQVSAGELDFCAERV